MRGMFEKWIINVAISFVIRQLAKYEAKTDWVLVKADLAARVAQVVPGTWFDDEAVGITDAFVDAVERAMENSKSLSIILALLADEKWEEAVSHLKSYLLKSWRPEATSTAENTARSLVESYV